MTIAIITIQFIISLLFRFLEIPSYSYMGSNYSLFYLMTVIYLFIIRIIHETLKRKAVEMRLIIYFWCLHHLDY